MFRFKKKKRIDIPTKYYKSLNDRLNDLANITTGYKDMDFEVDNTKSNLPKDTSIQVGDKVMLKKDMTKVYEVENIREGNFRSTPSGTPFRSAWLCEDMKETKYSLDNNRVYVEDQILPYREDSHLLALEIKKLKKKSSCKK